VRLRWIAALGSTGVLAVTAVVVVWQRWPVGVGDAAPALDVEWLHGEPVDPRSADAITVVELWATWCGPCRGAVPDLDAVQRRYAADGVRVVAVAVHDEPARVAEFVARHGPSLAYAIACDRDGRTAARWRERWVGWALPTTFVVDRDGRVAAVTHPNALDEVLAEMLGGRWVDDAGQARTRDARASSKRSTRTTGRAPSGRYLRAQRGEPGEGR
jgi:thiol-disulfide isomerase/thioredoxin